MDVTTKLDELCINTIRTLAMDAVQKANSGHPGTPMGAAPMAYAIWTRFLRHNPANPKWPDRDRFVLSPGHASLLLYGLLHLTGYDLSLEDIKQFRQWGSRTPGHPEYGHTAGVEATTGPLGQGFAMGVGMAIAERFLAEKFNRPGHTIVDHSVYALVSDGDLMEGLTSEAASFAGTLGLGKLIYLYDDNEISIEGSTQLAFREQVGERFKAYGWHVQHVADGNDIAAIQEAIEAARAETQRPSLIIVSTQIAYGSPHKAGTADAHGSPLGEEEVRLTKEALGWPVEPAFYEPPAAVAEFRKALDRGKNYQADWEQRLVDYAGAFQEDARAFKRAIEGELPEGWESCIPKFGAEEKPMATRVASGKVLNAIVETLPTLIGGSADLAPSTNTYLKGHGDFGFDEWNGQNMHFGVREHAMAASVNGMALHGGVIPYGATFLTFSDYMRPAIRLASLMQSHSILIFTHDSIGLGEDGPTHQPIEHLASLRAIPNLTVYRPADANETAACWRLALERRGPCALVLTRQNLPVIVDAGFEGVSHGAYVLAESASGAADIVLMATGSEVSIALEAQKQLSQAGIAARVVSMPSWELFEEQSQAYKDSVLPPLVRARVSIEAAASFGWSKYVGDGGEIVGIDHFGASAPGPVVMEKFGFTAEHITEVAKATIEKCKEMAKHG